MGMSLARRSGTTVCKEQGKSKGCHGMTHEKHDRGCTVVALDKEIAEEAIDLIERKLELLDSVHVASAIIRNAIFIGDGELKRRIGGLLVVKKSEEVLEEMKTRSSTTHP
jgi:hypothetical protein